MWDSWWTKWHWDRFFSKLFGFPCQYHSTVSLQLISSGGWTICPLVAAVHWRDLTRSKSTTKFTTIYRKLYISHRQRSVLGLLIRALLWVGRLDHKGETKFSYKILIEKTGTKRPPLMLVYRCEGNTRNKFFSFCSKELVGWLCLFPHYKDYSYK
jgi:hypothetical protein